MTVAATSVFTTGREELGTERFLRAISAGNTLCDTLIEKIMEEAGRPPFGLVYDAVLLGLENWLVYSEALMTEALEKGDWYTAVCYKAIVTALTLTRMDFTRTRIVRQHIIGSTGN